VTKLHNTGTHPLLEKLRRDTPDGVLDMLSVPGLKPEQITLLRTLVTRAQRGGIAAPEAHPES
jgi:DNA polymerase/3'-5' exonuclease PolX